METVYYLIEERDCGLESLIRLEVRVLNNCCVVSANYLMPHNFAPEQFVATYLPQDNQIVWGQDFIVNYKSRGLGTIMMAELICVCQQIAPKAGSSRLKFTAPIQEDNHDDNWERRERFYKSAGFNVHYTPEHPSSTGYAHIDDISRLKVNSDSKSFKKLSGIELAEKLDRLLSVNDNLSHQQENFQAAWRRQCNEVWELKKKLYRLRFIKWLAATLAAVSVTQLLGIIN